MWSVSLVAKCAHFEVVSRGLGHGGQVLGGVRIVVQLIHDEVVIAVLAVLVAVVGGL